ncbi:MAG TPA: SGNH/GDSL hydrolase family protein [Xanthobacteraceae bacterium]|nr:SGNH/GDSL hydrolase family protein [Xanthobacteraceae bacterium]
MRRRSIYFFGDSICFGQYVSPHEVWVTRLSAELCKWAERQGWQLLVQNPSINGETTRRALERMAYDVQSHSPDLLYIQFGMNDCNVWQTDAGHPRVSEAGFSANLREMIERGKRFGAKRVAIATNHPSTRTETLLPNTTVTYQQNNSRYNEIIRTVAAQYDGMATLVDMEREVLRYIGDDFGKLAELLLPDGIHLAKKGHEFYFERMKVLLLPILQEMCVWND